MQIRCSSRLTLRHFGPQKMTLQALGRKTYYTVIKGVCSPSRLFPMQMASSKDMLDTHTTQKRPQKGILGLFLTDFKMYVRDL